MSPTIQTVVTIVAVGLAAAYLLRSAWRSYVRAMRARRVVERERLCDPECGCGH